MNDLLSNLSFAFYGRACLSNKKLKEFQSLENDFSQKDWYKFGMAKNGCSEFIQTVLVQKDWKKIGMVKNGHSEFI